ncbi:hypothetical protein AAMO2058_000191700 [Amorphochlora amoebiformis]
MAYSARSNISDLVLLEKITEDEILKALKQRFKADQIYTYIGPVLLSVNPFKMINGMYSPSKIKDYQGKYIYEAAPHVYALAEDTYRQLKVDRVDQCVIISGESGSGKTEASKKLMQYIAATSGSSQGIQSVKNKILASNPLLEAFGNAKTVRNNNSSRFGKYMQIYFDLRNDPAGASIINYILEKSRVVCTAKDERNFHIFYQICTGLPMKEKQKYFIQDPKKFKYLTRSGCLKVDHMDDTRELKETLHGMHAIGMHQHEVEEVWSLISAVLWIGQVEFAPVTGDKSKVTNLDVVDKISTLLKVSKQAVTNALTSRHIQAGPGKAVLTYLDVEKAEYTRDALAKVIYSRLFDWIVRRLNVSLDLSHQTGSSKVDKKTASKIGVLDIFGFEIFKINSFEQFCINFVNEKLQQVFIEKTLKSEQDEYKSEGIKWVPVKYFNNKIVCDLIEKKPNGILKYLDDECVLPKGTDKTFYDKLVNVSFFRNHKHFAIPDVKEQGRGKNYKPSFILKHYAGDVKYCVAGFLDKNKDLTWKDLLDLGEESKLRIMDSMFPRGASSGMGSKRPPTIGTAFKKQVGQLMTALGSCQPHYIRCIKSNNQKRAAIFEDDLVLHQIKYLGLLENVRVRRAGFAFRETFTRFLKRYKMLEKSTWPQWEGSDVDGVVKVLKAMKSKHGDYELGKTKVFIKHPVTIFQLEEYRERKIHELVIKIQTVYRSWLARKHLLELRENSLGLFGRSKLRRTCSIRRFYVGDYLNYAKDQRIMVRVLGRNGDSQVKFADTAEKVNKRYKAQVRVLLLSEKTIYNLKPSGSLRRTIPIAKVTSVSVSKLPDNFMVIHVGSEYDYVYISERKTEFITTLNDLYKVINGGKSLPITFDNTLRYRIEGGRQRTLTFLESKGIEGTQWMVDRNNYDNLNITVGKISVVAYSALDAKMFKPKKKTLTELPFVSPAKPSSPKPKELWCTALFDFTAEESEELTFKKGDLMKVLERDPEWWVAELNGKKGFIPANYVKLVKNLERI